MILYLYQLPIYFQLIISIKNCLFFSPIRLTLQINNQQAVFFVMQKKLSVLHQNHQLQVLFGETQCSIIIITFGITQKCEKYTTNFVWNPNAKTTIENLPIEEAFNMFTIQQFGKPEQFCHFMSNPANYQINLAQEEVLLKWKIVAHDFRKKINHRIKLKKEQLSEKESLQCQVIILRRKLSDYEKAEQIRQKKNQKRKKGYKEIQMMEKSALQDDEAPKSTTKNRQQTKSKQKRKERVQEQKQRSSSEQEQQAKDKSEEEERKEGDQSLEVQFVNNGKSSYKKVKIGNKTRIDFCNGDYYFGDMKDDLFHGSGTYFSKKKNSSYEGQWKQGKADGFGKTIDGQGNRHQGYYMNDVRHGKGKDWYPNDEKFEGEFVNNNKEGFGIYYYSNGDRYEGYWKNNMYDGAGKQIYQNGDYFEGTWKEDEKDGQGILRTRYGIWKQRYCMGELVQERQENL